MTIEIGKPYLEEVDTNKCKLISDIVYEGMKKQFFIEFDSKYKEYVDTDCGDPFFAFLYQFAMIHNYDIKMLAPLSEEIAYNFQESLGEILPKKNSKFHRINVESKIKPASHTITMGNAVGCGFSGGVDSWCALLRNQSDYFSFYKVTHLCMFNFPVSGNGNESDENAFDEKKAFVSSIATKMGLETFYAKINPEEFYSSSECRRVQGGLIIGIVLAFTNLFGVYLNASDYSIADELDFSKDVDDGYRYVQFNTFSTNRTKFLYESPGLNRVEKMKYIMDNKLVQETLNVCGYENNNCGICEKCIRTQVTLDLYNCLEKFEKVFNLTKYNKMRYYFLARYAGRKNLSTHYQDVNEFYHMKHKFYPMRSYVMAPYFWITGMLRLYFLKNESKYRCIKKLYREKLKKYM